MKIIFLSTSEIALLTFYELIKHHEIVAVITQPDKAKGRSGKLVPSSIAIAAEKENIKVYKPVKIDVYLVEELKIFKADLFITFAYGVILKEDFLSITKVGGINIHPSLLPILRGPSPIQSAIMLGLKKSGISIQQMALKMDAGDILFQVEFDISEEDDEISLENKVGKISSQVIIPVLEKFQKGEIKPIPQDHSKATYCKLMKKEDGLIDWNKNGFEIMNKIRACIKWPVAYSFLEKEE